MASEPASSQAVGWAVEADCGHEAALLVGADWSGQANGRSRFAAEFLRRKQRAKHAGVPLSTLATGGDLPREHFELLVRQGITAIRASRGSEISGQRGRPPAPGISSLRYGLWQVPADMRLSGGGWLSGTIAALRICRAIDRRIAAGIAGHLAIDAPALAARSNGKLSALKTVLRHIERRQREGTLQVGTIAATVGRLAPARTGRSAQSILRAA
ncbi:MAG TPA: hypothetical protein VG056_10685 [Pirellulales bacterium]|nr:hypothetical protein [Pirellulales bacterium]